MDNNDSSSSSGDFDKREDENVCTPCIPPNYSQSNSSDKSRKSKLSNMTFNNKRNQPPPYLNPPQSKQKYQQQHQQNQQYQQQHQQQYQQKQRYQEQNMTELTQKHMTRASQLSNSGTVASLISKCTLQNLPYTIYNYSSQSGSYSAQNICVNQPMQQSSRWSSASHDHEQYITIQFETPVIARTITFGKFHKGHVCNLKEFKVFGGLNPNEDLIELLHGGLKNNTEPETFPLKHQYKGLMLPIKYIKIVPLAAFGANFNYSIWYVEMRGILDESIMHRVCNEYDQYKEAETTRLCLKYFRQKNMMDVFHILKNRTGIELEHPFVSELHQCLVIEADFEAAEHVLHQAHRRQIYHSYSDSSKYIPVWRQVTTNPENGESPSGRGGHQMCIDIHDEKIYILGGWDGYEDLSDFWCYDIRNDAWCLLSKDTQADGGPGPRSCHKICFDPTSRSIFVLGKYVDSQEAHGKTLESEFYRYHIDTNEWIKLSDNTASEGGPELIFDHQMCIDPQSETLYVFGGRTVTGDINIQKYSGLYSYKIQSKEWNLIRNDGFSLIDSAKHGSSALLKSRVGHSMLFDEACRSLYIFAGQRVKDYLSDLYRYNIDNDVVTEISQDASRGTGPDAGFTQRATMDEQLEELYVFSGYLRSVTGAGVRNAFWVYSIKNNEWQKVYQKEENETGWQNEPSPRFAHQMVYDPLSRTQYVFGGNPGDKLDSTKRLDDFWELKLTKPDPSAILKKSLFKIRMQKLRELCSRACNEQQYSSSIDENSNLMVALDYLRNQVVPVVNHDDETECGEFHQICADLCLFESMIDDDVGSSNDSVLYNIAKSEDALYAERTQLFEKLLEFIPQEMKEPSGKLTNAIRFS